MALRSIFGGVVVLFASSTMTASASDVRQAYDAALKCYVANGYVADSFKKSGDTANAELFEGKAHRSFDVASGHGLTLHLGRDEMSRDFQRATDTELPRLISDKSYLTTVAKDCKFWGLM